MDALPLIATIAVILSVMLLLRALRSGRRTLPPLTGSLRRKRERQREESTAFRLLEPLIRELGAVNASFELTSFRQWIAAKLSLSGNPSGLRPDEFIGQCQIGAVAGLLMATYVSATVMGPNVALMVVLAAFGFYVPILSLNQAVTQRQRDADKGLPYAVNLIVLGMEAGLDFSMAVQRYVDLGTRNRDVMLEELQQVLNEVEGGKPMNEALLALAERIPTGAIKSLVISIVQAERLGTPLAKVLREQVSVIQTRRIQLAEKMAGESAVKILGPLMFIFAAVFLVLFNSMIIQAVTGEI